MKQTLHIFRKDTRRFWPEILTSIVITAAFVLLYPNRWRIFQDESLRREMLEFISILGTLMPISWWLVIARATHAETLVGDEQFWITRPYEWKKLFAAKVLFLLTWVGLPYLLAQSLMLAEAGFHPLSYVPGLLFNLLIVSAIFFLPLFSIAAVTSNFARMTLTLLACLVLFTGYSFLVNVPRGYTPSTPYQDPFLVPLLFCGCAVAITLQYATRRVWLSRGLLIALPLLLAVTVAVYRSQSMVDRGYPQPSPGSSPPVSVSFTPDPNHPVQARSWEGEDYIDLPIHYADVAEGYAVITNNFKFSFTAADGTQWTSPWQQLHSHSLPGAHRAFLALMLAPAVYDRFKSAPVTLHITFALSRYQADTVTNMSYPSSDVAVSGVGLCTPVVDPNQMLVCRSALRQPRLTYAAALWSNLPCSDSPPPPEATSQGEGWLEPNEPDFAMTSVWTPTLWFSNNKPGDGHSRWRLCPGTPLTLTQYDLAARTRTDLTIPNFQLPASITRTGY
jgi:hypothetical protein